MRKFLLPILFLSLVASCGEDDPVVEPVPEPDPEPVVKPEPEPEPEPEPVPTFDSEFVAAKVDINTAGSVPVVEKKTWIDCTVSLAGAANPEWDFTELSAQIRGRGNSTWLWYPKKPYRVKFAKKQAFMGLTATKQWAFLAEYRDPTDLMNTFVFELGQMMGLPFTNGNRYVELTLNGDFLGLYHVTEQIKVASGCVDIDDVNGYLLSLDRDDGPELAPEESDNFWSEVYGMPVCVKSPEDLPAEGMAKAKAELAVLENAIKSRKYADIAALLDIPSMIDYLIIQELVYNVEMDAPRSVYMHRDAGKKWFMGPLWDFDAGFDFDWNNMTKSHNYFADYRELVYGTNPATHAGTIYNGPGFFSDLFRIPQFVKEYQARWKEVSPMVSKAMDRSEQFYKANEAAFARDASRWPISCNYVNEIPRMRSWLDSRVAFLNDVIANY